MGTNRNDRLHRDLNSVFTNSKYGVEYAFTLLTTTFYRHNDEIVARNEHRDPFPIQIHETLPNTAEEFGLSSPVSIGEHVETDIHKSLTRAFHEVTYDELENEIKYVLVQKEKFEDDGYLTLEEAVDILLEACRYHYVILQKRKGMAIEIHELLLHSCYPDITVKIPLLKEQHQSPVINQQLSHTLSAWGFELVHVEGNGNCLFMSIAQAVADDESIKMVLHLDYSRGYQFVANQLGQLMVEEWLGEHAEDYQGFLPHVYMSAGGARTLQRGWHFHWRFG